MIVRINPARHLIYCPIAAIQKTAELLAKTPNPAWTPWVKKAQEFLSSVQHDRMTLPEVRKTLEVLASSAAAIEAFRERMRENAAKLEELKGKPFDLSFLRRTPKAKRRPNRDRG